MLRMYALRASLRFEVLHECMELNSPPIINIVEYKNEFGNFVSVRGKVDCFSNGEIYT